jgi:hypothetical protein
VVVVEVIVTQLVRYRFTMEVGEVTPLDLDARVLARVDAGDWPDDDNSVIGERVAITVDGREVVIRDGP